MDICKNSPNSWNHKIGNLLKLKISENLTKIGNVQKFSKSESWAKLELFLIEKLETFDNKLEKFTNYWNSIFFLFIVYLR